MTASETGKRGGWARLAMRAFLAGMAGTAVLALGVQAQAATEEYVKYYTVTSAYNGKPEDLTEIATRFLGSGARSAEIFNLNTRREQPDGKVLTDPDRLRAGWMLVMPWDAVGAGIQYGVLPKPAPKPKATTKGVTTPPAGQTTPATGTRPSPQAGVTPSAAAKPPTVPVTTGCASTAASSTKSDWARLRLAADKAWPQSRGKGQLVAIVDSGVNGAMPQLAGHVSVGADVVDPKQRGDTDCLGTGTAMAALVVAKQVKGEGPAGAAPDATVMPVRMVANQPAATVDLQVKAIETAVSAGATVIALGSYVDGEDTEVAQAIGTAVSRDVVVILGAPAAAKPVNPQATLGEGILRVAGVGVDDQWAVDYRKGEVDVSAPGVNVSSLGSLGGTGGGAVTGSGTHYAVAYAAAEAALVRSAYPDLTAQQVTHRIKATADRMGDGEPPHNQYGWGFLNPAEAVTKVLSEEAQTAALPATETVTKLDVAKEGGSGGRKTVLIVTAILMIGAALLLAHRIRRLLRNDDDHATLAAREPEIDLYDPRFRTPAPALVTSGGTSQDVATGGAGPAPFDDGGDDHWSQVGGHWSDGPSPAGDSDSRKPELG